VKVEKNDDEIVVDHEWKDLSNGVVKVSVITPRPSALSRGQPVRTAVSEIARAKVPMVVGRMFVTPSSVNRRLVVRRHRARGEGSSTASAKRTRSSKESDRLSFVREFHLGRRSDGET
jgi:hypothetical protein